MEYIFLTIIILILLIGVFLTFRFSGKKNLSKSQKTYYKQEIQKTSTLPSLQEQILQYDKILNHILKDYGYGGTVADQLKEKPRIIHNLDIIWNLHKIRNKLAHDMEPVSIDLLDKKAQEFEKEILRLL